MPEDDDSFLRELQPRISHSFTRINLLSLAGQAGCDAIVTGVQFQPTLWTPVNASAASKAANIASGRYLCNTDYGAQYMLAAPKEARNMVMRATAKLSETDVAFFEWTGSRTEVKSELTPTQFSTTAAAGNFYPVSGPHYLNLKTFGVNDFDPTKPISYRWRMQDYGNRVIENVSTNDRFLVGMEGELGKYSYKLGLSKAEAEGYANLIDGYAYSAKLNAALKTGIINPFLKPGEKQTQAAMDLIESTKARGRLQGGRTGLSQFDGALTGELFKLPAGPLDFAVGFDLRRETYEFAGDGGFTCVSTLATTITTDVLLCPGNSTVPLVSRDVKAVYGELAIPVFKGFDMQVAVRHDSYSSIGGTTNPKVGFKFQPLDSLLLRGSVNTGFKAPSFQQQQPNTAPLEFTGRFDDPVKCPTDPTQCQIIGLDYTSSGNPDLKPEKSKQGTVGIVFAPLKDLVISADYWRVDLSDRIRTLTINDVVNNYSLFPDRFIRDPATGNVSIVRAGWINAADSSTRGVDWDVNYALRTDFGRFKASVSGTHMLSHKERPLETLPMTEYVGEFGLRTLYLRDKFNASLRWSQGDWSSTVTASYKSSYKDQNLDGRATLPSTANTSVPSYTLVGLYGTYTGFKNASITVGLRNLFDKQPPFTHHDVDDVVGAGWDPRVADPFGRTLTVALKYSFN